MFKRLLLEDYAGICLAVAFATAATIFFGFLWRALRMPRAQVEYFARLPFSPESSRPPSPPSQPHCHSPRA